MIGITINKLIFNNGREIDLSPSDIVVFVGPNNMGKSQSLRDIFNSISNDHGSIVVRDVGVEFHNPQELKNVVERLSLTTPNGQYFLHRGYQYQIHSSNLNGFGENRYVDEQIKKFLVSMVKTEERLTTSNPKLMVNPGNPNEHPLQYVTNPDNRKAMSGIFELIFGKKIFCEDRGSTMLTLHMGDDIMFNQVGKTPQQVSDELYKRMEALPKVHEQGDGIRSLAGLLLNLMIPNYSMFLIDEPEAFLHPPQARVLGENLPDQLGDKQAFISTHSIELIKGLLTKAHQRVKIVRITREGRLNPVKELKQADMADIWNDPIMRHTNILDCIFYHHTVLCESDSDCLLYGAMLDKIKDSRGNSNDSLFIHCGGKGRMHKVVKALKSLGVNYRIIPDIDVFDERSQAKLLYEACGGNWSTIEADYNILAANMNQPAGVLTEEELIVKIKGIISQRQWSQIKKPEVNRLRKEMKTILDSQWDKLKHEGVTMIAEVTVKDAMNRLLEAFRKVGIYPVTQGELENFIPNVGNHGPSWAISVMEKYPDLNDAIYNNLRNFVNTWGIA